MRRVILTLTLIAAVLAGCSGRGPHASPTTPTTLGPNPDIVPQIITADYVNAVFKVLNHLDGDVTRSLIAGGTITTQDYAILRAIYNDPLYQEEVNIAQETLKGDLTVFRRPPGDIVTKVEQLIDSSPTCLFVKTHSDFQQVVKRPPTASASEYWRLSPKQSSADPDGINSTSWALSFNANFNTPTTVPDQCSAR